MKREDLKNARTIVLKLGSAVLTHADNRSLDRGNFCRIIEIISLLRSQGKHIIIVTSGAVALGRNLMDISSKPDRKKYLPKLQALAAIGQSQLMQYYESELRHYHIKCAQILVTRQDLENHTRFQNAKRTIETLLEMDVIPIINENDTIATDEIRFGDNDSLAALIAVLIRADLIAVFSDIDAIYTANPKTCPDATPIDTIPARDASLDVYAEDTTNAKTGVGTGGMITKIYAARIAANLGIPTLIFNGKNPQALFDALDGKHIGTLLYPDQSPINQHKVWILSLKTHAQVLCDEGATEALRFQSKNLLPSGVTSINGRFDEGDPVEICDGNGKPFAKGIILYNDIDTSKIIRHRSSEIESILGYHISDLLIRREDLVLLPTADDGATL